MNQLKYFQIIQELKKMRSLNEPSIIKIRILSNIIVHQLVDILEFWLRKLDIPCEITLGNYDNIVQDAVDIPRDEVVILFWESANIVDGFHYLIRCMKTEEKIAHHEQVKKELLMVFNSLKNHKKVFFNLFHSKPFENTIKPEAFELFVGELNSWTRKNIPSNFKLIDLSPIFMKIGLDQCFDLRNFFSSKALYSIDFHKAYSSQITPMIAALTGRVKKALILDCDNTLWNGIVGEDGKEGIKITIPYLIAQSTIIDLYSKGVLICLCSKNNPDDVEEVLTSHEGMLLKNEHIVLKKINWQDKASNIKAIGKELNLGLNSFIFVDDSPFEANLISEQLPEVTVFQVPEKINDFPEIMAEVAHQFFRFEVSAEDLKKTEQYRLQAKRKEAEIAFQSIDDYLRSLELHLTIEKNNRQLVPRIAQMTQKTNQFNLTTKRYTEQDITHLMDNHQHEVYTLAVKDRFGDSGVTGLMIIENKETEVEIDTLLISCRILGRNIEWAFVDQIVKEIKKPILKAKFIPTQKNAQVSDFYDKLGFTLMALDNGIKSYQIRTSDYRLKTAIDYIKVELWKNS